MSVAQPPVARSAARSVVWACCSFGTGKLLALATMMVLARLLTPTDFGLMAFALVYIMYLETLGDLGTSAALVYWPAREHDAARVSFLITVVTGWIWFAITLLIAPQVAAFFHNPESEAILRALAWSFPIKALGATQDALCQKRLRFGRRLVPEVALSGVKAVVAITLALKGFGVWSLVWGQLAGVATWTIALWTVVGWRPDARVPWDLVWPMLRYGGGVVAVNALAALLHHIDLVIVGRIAGAAALGVYQLAYKIPEVLIALPIWIAGTVLFPAFARVRQQGSAADLRDAYLTTMRYGTLLTCPSVAALVLFAAPLVTLAFGARWLVAVPILRALAIYGLLRSLGSPAGDVIKAVGRPGLLAILGVIKAAVLVPALLIAGMSGSPLGVASTLAALTGGTALLNQAVVARVAGIRLRDVAAELVPGILAAAAFLLVAATGQAIFGRIDMVGVVVLGSLGALAAAAAVRVHSPELFAAAASTLWSSREPVAALGSR